jgi:hypothetical protein
MSLEKRKDTEKSEKEQTLKESTFRRNDFTPLGLKEDLAREKSEIESQTDEIEVEEIVEELTEIEKDVLEIAEEVLKLKRYDSEFEIETKSQIQKFPIIEKLYATCISKLSYNKGYSKEDIFLAIRGLEEKNWIVTNERRTKLEILNNEKLLAVLDFIGKNPGVHARDEKIEKELGITRTPFIKHVITLERFELIRSKKIGKTLHYFLEDITESYDEIKAIFLNPLIPQIIEEIFKDETITISSMGEIMEVYPGTINYHLKKMKSLNLVKAVKNKQGKKIHLINVDLLKKYNRVFKEPDFTDLLKGL